MEKYYKIRLTNGFQLEDDSETNFNELKVKNRVVEEVMETFLFLHLCALTGRNDLRAIIRPPSGTWKLQDISAISKDTGDMQFFELKRNNINRKTLEQVNDYLKIFKSSDRKKEIDELYKWRTEHLTKNKIALLLTGAVVNLRTANEGIKAIQKASQSILEKQNTLRFISGYFKNKELTKSNYSNLGDLNDKASLLAKALLYNKFQNIELYEKLCEYAEKWYNNLNPSVGFNNLSNHKEYNDTLWAVAPAITQDGKNKLEEMRKNRINVKILLLEIRKQPNQHNWFVKVQDEEE